MQRTGIKLIIKAKIKIAVFYWFTITVFEINTRSFILLHENNVIAENDHL